jgi:hypothetical protein
VVELGATKFQDGHWQSDFYFKLEDEPDG